MTNRYPKIILTITLPLLILAGLLGLALLIGGAYGNKTARPVQTDGNAPIIVARRVISIPFGINSVLPLSSDGTSVLVSGPGVCPSGETFTIHTMVTQNGQQQRAIGSTEGDCEDAANWSVTAVAPGNHMLVPGPAEVCSTLIIFGAPNGALVGDWCKNVTLEQQ